MPDPGHPGNPHYAKPDKPKDAPASVVNNHYSLIRIPHELGCAAMILAVAALLWVWSGCPVFWR